jgi:hypothetical protein
VGERLDDKDIPHRTKLSELITKAFKREYAAMINGIQVRVLRSFGIQFQYFTTSLSAEL